MLSEPGQISTAPMIRQELYSRRPLAMLLAVLTGCFLVALGLLGRSGAFTPHPDAYAAFAQRFPAILAKLTPVYHYEVVRAYPHDPNAFTEGLIFDHGYLFESTGLWGKSSLRKVDLQTGRVLQQVFLKPKYFGEGLTSWHGRLIQLTWQSSTGFVYAQDSFRRLEKFTYVGQGWGLTHDADALIMSDGTSTLRFLDPNSLQEIKRITVRDEGVPIKNLNELEYIDGDIFANIWLTDYIAIISPQTGDVQAWLDLSSLCRQVRSQQRVDVLNGIAYDASHHRIFVTGKFWPWLYEIKIVK